MESTEWKTDGLIFCWSWYGLKETSLSVCQVMKPPWELTDTHCSEAAELCTAVVYYWQLQTHADAHTDTVGVLVSRGVTFVPASVCSHVSPEVVLVLSLHCCRHTHDEDPKVPLVCVCDHHPAFIPSVLWWPDQSCLSHPVWFCFCGPGTSSTPSSRRIKSTIVLHFRSQCSFLNLQREKQSVSTHPSLCFLCIVITVWKKNLWQALKNQTGHLTTFAGQRNTPLNGYNLLD